MTTRYKKSRDFTSGFLICLLAAVVFLFALTRLALGIATSVGLALATLLLLPALARLFRFVRDRRHTIMALRQQDPQARRRLELWSKVKAIAITSRSIREPTLSIPARNIAKTAAVILRKAEKDPARFRLLHRFFDYYLQSALTILHRCETLTNSPVFDREMDRQIQQAAEVLIRLHKLLERQIITILQSDVWELEVERKALQKLMNDTFSTDQPKEGPN